MKNWLFYLGFGFIATHELDAVTQQEWRLLYILRSLPEPLAAQAFVAVHVPLFAALIWLTQHPKLSLRSVARMALMVFLVVHVFLHWRLSGHALYSFHSPLSIVLIWGGGLMGLLYCITSLRQRR